MPQSELVYRAARSADIPGIETLLDDCELRSEDVCVPRTHYELAEDGKQIVGVVGIENAGGQAVLLRSLAVSPAHRSHGVGRELMKRITEIAAQSATDMFLFSTDAGDYYRSLGYCEVPVDEVVMAVGQTPQVVKYRELGWLPTEVAWRKSLPVGQST